GEARALLDRAVEVGRKLPGVEHSAARAKVLHAAGRLTELSDQPLARQSYLESLRIRRDIGDRWGMVSSLNNLGNIARLRGENVDAANLYEEALKIAHELGDEWAATILLNNLGELARMRGDRSGARELATDSLA